MLRLHSFSCCTTSSDIDSGDLVQGDIANNKNLVVDNISIQHLPMDCKELILNTDMQMGHARFWDE